MSDSQVAQTTISPNSDDAIEQAMMAEIKVLRDKIDGAQVPPELKGKVSTMLKKFLTISIG
jgi:hypothetical protein